MELHNDGNFFPGDRVVVKSFTTTKNHSVTETHNATVKHFSDFILKNENSENSYVKPYITEIFLDKEKTNRLLSNDKARNRPELYTDPTLLNIGQIVYLKGSPDAYSVYEKIYFINLDTYEYNRTFYETTSVAYSSHSDMKLITVPVEIDDNCPICFDNLTESVNAADGIVSAHKDSSNHLFHKTCLQGWQNSLQGWQKKTCPICRIPMTITPVKVSIRPHEGGKNKKSRKNKRRQRKTRKQKKQRYEFGP